jgi:hypothetical protein
MPDLILRRNAVVKAYQDDFLVILRMADGYELQAGDISKQSGAHLRVFWQWSCPGGTGRSDTREDAMVAVRAAWSATDQELAAPRRQQERTEWKYALWDSGYADKLGKGPIQCVCGQLFSTKDHEALRIHIDHIKAGPNRGNKRP